MTTNFSPETNTQNSRGVAHDHFTPAFDQPLSNGQPSNGQLSNGQPTNSQAGAGLLFLREEEFRIAQDKLFFALRDLNATVDAALHPLGFGRAHQRCLHWIGRLPGLNVGELLSILGITKQSLARVLGPLIRQGYIQQTKGTVDRRQRLLSLTEKGVAFERSVFEFQRERLAAAYRDAGGPAVEGFRNVLRGMTTDQGRKWLDRLESARVQKGQRAAI